MDVREGEELRVGLWSEQLGKWWCYLLTWAGRRTEI